MDPKITSTYDEEKIFFFKDLWTKVINSLLLNGDPKKIISFLNRCGII